MQFPVSESALADLERRMAALQITEAEFEESFVRSSGPGGQNVNKVATCVQLTHRPTGLSVKCQETRSQATNRFLARRLLVEELERRTQGQASEAEREIWKIRKQKRKRSRRAKAKLLRDKRFRAEKKSLRGRVDW